MGHSEILRSLRHRDYRLYFFGQFVSMVGTWMQQTAQSWLIYRLTGSGVLLGLVAAAGQGPSLLLGLVGGAAADRWDRRLVLQWTQSAALAQAAVLAVLTSAGMVKVWHIMLLAVFLGIINAFDMPARQAFVPELVPREDMGNAIAMSGILLNASRMIGPAFAGFLIARAGEAACFWLNAVSYVAVVASLMMIRTARTQRSDSGEGELARIIEGVRYAFQDPERRAIFALLTAVSLAAVPAISILPVYSEGVLRAGPAGLGALTAAFAVGALGASVMLARRVYPEELASTVGWAAAGFGTAIAALSTLRGFSAACGMMGLAGCGMMICYSGGNIRLQDRSSDSMRGRVMALFSMTFTATAPFGTLAMGWASDHFGAPTALAAGGSICVLCGLVYLAGRPTTRAAVAVAVALILGSVVSPAYAAPRAMTWEECVAEAIRANPDLAASRFSLDSARASYFGSFNGVMPNVTLTNSVSETNTARSASWGAQAAASLKLLDAGNISSIRSAAAAQALADANLRKASADARASLRQAFSRALLAEKSLVVARRIGELRDHDAEMVGLRYNSGRESKGNMLRARAQALQARFAIAQSEREIFSARQELARRLGREDFEDFIASGTLGASRLPESQDDWRSLLALRTDVRVAEAGVRRARAALAQAESPLWPSLSANYTRGRADRVEFPSARYSWSAGATLSYALFGGGPTSTWFSVQSSRRDLNAAEAGLASARTLALADLRGAWASFADAVEQVRVLTALLEADRQRNDEADVRYASGLLSFDNWEPIVSARVATEQQAVSALRAAMDAETAWDRALGRALGE